MDVYVLLDILLIILVALFIPIGFWRGAYRESFVTLGILFGASLGWFWGERWGTELAAVSRLHEAGGAFMIAMLCLISATFLLGYSAGAAIPVPDPGWLARTLGALIAGANGALLLSFALRDIRTYLLTSEEVGFLDNAVVAPFLSDGTGWILLVGAAVFVPIALVLALFGPDIEEDEYYETGEYDALDEDGYETYPQRPLQTAQHGPVFQQRPNPVRPVPSARPAPVEAEETRPVPVMGHQQPAPEEPAVTQRRVQPGPEMTQPYSHPPRSAFGIQPQAPLQETESDSTRENATESAAEQTPAPGHQIDRTAPTDDSAEETPPPGHPAMPEVRQPSFGTHTVEESISEREVVFGHRPEPPAGAESSPETPSQTPGRCPNCMADVRDASGFCPRCGARI